MTTASHIQAPEISEFFQQLEGIYAIAEDKAGNRRQFMTTITNPQEAYDSFLAMCKEEGFFPENIELYIPDA